MKDKILRALASVTTVLVLVSSLAVTTLSASDFDIDADAVIEYAYSAAGFASASDWLDSGDISEWYAFALLRRGGGLDFDRYADALLSRLDVIPIHSAVERQRCALTLAFAGYADNDFVTQTPDETIGKGGIMSYVFGLHLLFAGVSSEDHSTDTVIDELLSRRLPDGGWAVSGTVSDVDVTAMTLQALAPYVSDTDVKTAVDSALSYLASAQLDSGGFKSYGTENPESTAQVIIALCSLGIDPRDNDIFDSGDVFAAIESFRTADGGYSHTSGGTSNATATVQVLLAKIACDRFYSGDAPLYALDANSPDDTDTADTATDTADTTESGAVTSDDTQTETSEPKEEGDGDNSKSSYKPIAITVTVVIAVGAAVTLILLGKRSGKNFAVIIVLTVVAVAIIVFVDFSLPEDYYGTTDEKMNVIGTVTVSVDVSAVLSLDADGILPKDGIVLPPTEIQIEDGDTAYSVTVEACRLAGLHIETATGSSYVRGIANIYEFDFGELSGWTYTVNGVSPAVGCDNYTLSDGDELVWHYVTEPTRITE